MDKEKGFETKYEVMIELAYQKHNLKQAKKREKRIYIETQVIPALERILKQFEAKEAQEAEEQQQEE